MQLPAERTIRIIQMPKNIIITVNKDGDIFWRGYRTPVASEEELFDKMKVESKLRFQPEVHIRGDQNARYEAIGKTMLVVQRWYWYRKLVSF